MRTFIFTNFILAIALVAAGQMVSNASSQGEYEARAEYRYVKAALVATHTDETPMFAINSTAKSDKQAVN